MASWSVRLLPRARHERHYLCGVGRGPSVVSDMAWRWLHRRGLAVLCPSSPFAGQEPGRSKAAAAQGCCLRTIDSWTFGGGRVEGLKGHGLLRDRSADEYDARCLVIQPGDQGWNSRPGHPPPVTCCLLRAVRCSVLVHRPPYSLKVSITSWSVRPRTGRTPTTSAELVGVQA